MKLDDVITKLQEIRKERGNIELETYPYDGQMRTQSIISIDVCATRTIGWDDRKKEWIYQNCEPYVIAAAE